MKSEIRSSNVDISRKERDFIEKCLYFAFNRFADKIRRFRVWIRDENGPKGGKDHNCKMELVLETGGSIYVTNRGEDVYTAIYRLAQKANRKLRRHLNKKRRFSKPLPYSIV